MKIGDSVVVSEKCALSFARRATGVISDIQLDRNHRARVCVILDKPLITLSDNKITKLPWLFATDVRVKEEKS